MLERIKNPMKIGVLGGIGPEATGYFYSELVKRLKKSSAVERNSDYPQVIINSINAPELVTADISDEMLEPYVSGIQELAKHNPDFIVMVCNTIHLFRDRLIAQSGFENIISLRAAVQEKLLEKREGQVLCILGTPATVGSGLFHFPEFLYQNPTQSDLNAIAEIVVDYNATGNFVRNKKRLMEIVEKQKSLGAQVFVAACTEISELLTGEENVPKEDTLDILVEHTLNLILLGLKQKRKV